MFMSNSLGLSDSSPSSNSKEWIKRAGWSAEAWTSLVMTLYELVWGARSGDRDIERSLSYSRLGKGITSCKLDLD